MDFGGVVGVGAIMIAVFLSMIVFIWQINSQSGRFDSKIESLQAEIKAQGDRLNARIEAQGDRLDARIEAQGGRVSDSELEQARLNGVNSVLTIQAHTHES